MKFLFDFFPIVLFFITFKLYGIYFATIVAILATLIQVLFSWINRGKLEPMHLITLVIILLFGGATLLFQNEIFIKWKPTVINWVFAVVLFGSHFFGEKNLIQRLLEKNIKLPTVIWKRLNLSWIVFFSVMGLANLYVAYEYDTNVWVNFKLFGVLGLTLVFVIIQSIYLSKHLAGQAENYK